MIQLKSQFPANPREVSLDFSRTSESCLNVWQNILGTNVLQKNQSLR